MSEKLSIAREYEFFTLQSEGFNQKNFWLSGFWQRNKLAQLIAQ